MKRESVLLSETESVPLEKEVLIGNFQKYITQKNLYKFAIKKWTAGINFVELMNHFNCTRKSSTNTEVLSCSKDLFTARDLEYQGIDLPPQFRNRIPQRYYLSSMKASIMEKIKHQLKSVLLPTTGSQYFKAPLFQCLESQKANCFLELLQSLSYSTRYIHKLNLEVRIDKKHYAEIEMPSYAHSTGIEENIGTSNVRYKYHLNGTVQVFVSCSKNPYRLEQENDVERLQSVFGAIEDRMSSHLYDPRHRIVPPVERWILKQCDINVDIEISDMAQLYLPDIQLATAGKVFRMYVKPMGAKSVYRIEDSKEFNSPLISALNGLSKPDQNLEQKIDLLSKQFMDIASLLKTQISINKTIAIPWLPSII